VKRPVRAAGVKKKWQSGLVPDAEVPADGKLGDYDAAVKHLRQGGDLAQVPDEHILEAMLDADMKDALGNTFKFGDIMKGGNQFVRGARLHNDRFDMKKIKGDVVEIKSKSRQMIVLRHNLDTLDRAVPAWLEVSSADFKATVRDLPLREQIDVPVREQLIVELYSK
jgi:hypothetical protein